MHDSHTPRAEERFAGPVDVLSLDNEAAELGDTLRSSGRDHTQKTLYRCGGTTVAMFAIQAMKGLPPHAVDGVVTIQPIEGEVSVHAADEEMKLRPGELLRMRPSVQHDVRAETPSIIMVHIARAHPA